MLKESNELVACGRSELTRIDFLSIGKQRTQSDFTTAVRHKKLLSRQILLKDAS